jgi:alginate O-acetyltransferase complex protein AlgI
VLFNSHLFILLFLPLVWLGFWCLTRWASVRAGALWLTLASYAFYGHWNLAYLPLLAGSVAANFLLGLAITRAPRQGIYATALLALGLTANLILLAWYKYAGFLVQSVNAVTDLELAVVQWVLPLGISFYTFTQIAYLVDAWREDLSHYDFLSYNLFITFFPQLIAGPLLLHRELMPKLQSPTLGRLESGVVLTGMVWFSAGLAKKVLLADEVAPLVAPAFDATGAVNMVTAWIGVLAYTVQLYFDFSGYSDMAIGLGLMFGIRLPMNFNSPYRARSIIDFWRRWHMTLSRFLRDYLYIPLGGNRRGALRRHFNLTITMVLGGLWHGAGWTFVIWGALHGLYLMINHLWRALGLRLPGPVAWLLTFLAVTTAWVFFRAPSLERALALLNAMLGGQGLSLPAPLGAYLAPWLAGWSPVTVAFVEHQGTPAELLTLLLLLAGAIVLPNTGQLLQGDGAVRRRWAVAGGAMVALAMMSLSRPSEFLYFQF